VGLVGLSPPRAEQLEKMSLFGASVLGSCEEKYPNRSHVGRQSSNSRHRRSTKHLVAQGRMYQAIGLVYDSQITGSALAFIITMSVIL
jgi:hypothetical protein